jgi:hypothetical protein
MPWVQYFLNPTQSASNASQNGRSAATDTDGDASAALGAGGGFGPRLSDQIGLALLGLADGANRATQASGQSSGVTSTGTTTASTTADSDLSKIFSDLESLFASFTGSTASSGSSTATSGSTSSVSDTGTSSATDPAGQLLLDLQQFATDMSTASLSPASTTSGTQSAPPGPPAEASPWDNDISNSGTVAADATGNIGGSGTVAGHHGGFWQHFVLSAYAAATGGTAATSSTSVKA